MASGRKVLDFFTSEGNAKVISEFEDIGDGKGEPPGW
jgi:hypothetical protein